MVSGLDWFSLCECPCAVYVNDTESCLGLGEG